MLTRCVRGRHKPNRCNQSQKNRSLRAHSLTLFLHTSACFVSVWFVCFVFFFTCTETVIVHCSLASLGNIFRYSTIWLQRKHHSTSSLDCICTNTTLQGKWLRKHRFVHGGVKPKMANTPGRQEEAAPAGDAFVHDQTLETLFNYGGLAPR